VTSQKDKQKTQHKAKSTH